MLLPSRSLSLNTIYWFIATDSDRLSARSPPKTPLSAQVPVIFMQMDNLIKNEFVEAAGDGELLAPSRPFHVIIDLSLANRFRVSTEPINELIAKLR